MTRSENKAVGLGPGRLFLAVWYATRLAFAVVIGATLGVLAVAAYLSFSDPHFWGPGLNP
ncbi:MAG: hypothetical protein ACRBK7_14460 [Acidimicrobiales bacterium]